MWESYLFFFKERNASWIQFLSLIRSLNLKENVNIVPLMMLTSTITESMWSWLQNNTNKLKDKTRWQTYMTSTFIFFALFFELTTGQLTEMLFDVKDVTKNSFPLTGNGFCAKAGNGLKSPTHQLLCFHWPQWNCSRWKWGHCTNIWMTVCLVVRHNRPHCGPVSSQSRQPLV